MYYIYRVFLMVVFGLCSSFAVQAAQVKLTYCMEDKELFPYFLGEGASIPTDFPGINVEFLRLIEREMPEVSIDFVRRPFERCKVYLKQGPNYFLTASYKEARLELGDYPNINGKLDESRYLSSSGYYLYQLKDKPHYWDGKGFSSDKKLEFAVPIGYSIISMLEEHNIKVHKTRNSQKAMDMLATNRVHGTVLFPLSANAILAQNPKHAELIKKVTPAVKEKLYYFMFSKQFAAQHPELAQKFWDLTRDMREKHYDNLARKYIKQFNYQPE